MKKRMNLKSKDGFTIVELMIALSVLSTILVITTVILIQIGSLYSKGVNAANLQNTSRAIEADVSSALQFSGSVPTTCPAGTAGTVCDAASNDPAHPNPGNFANGGVSVTVHAVCIGTIRYSYVMGREQGTDPTAVPATNAQTPHVLWRDTIQQNANCQPLDLSVPQVLADNTSNDAAAGSPSGGYDMVPDHMRLTRFKIEPTLPTGNIYTIDVWMAFGDSDLVVTGPTGSSTCQGGAGTQFCSTSQISSSIAGRVY